MNSSDKKTAEAFSTSWNTLPEGSVYTPDQAEDWFAPLSPSDFAGKTVLELGCGNASLLCHVTRWGPKLLIGVDLGDSVKAAARNVAGLGFPWVHIVQSDLNSFRSREPFDVVYCIGVLHHLRDPEKGFESALHLVKPGGTFHCWVYAHEGNGLVRTFVDPLRRLVSRLPWWLTKFGVALPLSVGLFLVSRLVSKLSGKRIAAAIPMNAYFQWIARREFRFHWHVAFDQLVTPTTHYLPRGTIEKWLTNEMIDRNSTYLIHRNGNSWKFGGRIKPL